MLNQISDLVDPLESLLDIVFQQYLTKCYCFIIITETVLNLKLLSANIPNVRLNSTRFDAILTATDHGCTDYLVQLEKPEKFVKVFEKVNKISEIRKGDRKLIFLPTSKDNTKSMLNLLQLKEISNIPNVLLIIPLQSIQSCQMYDLITHTFVGEDSKVRNPTTLATWDSCKQEFQSHTNLFPHDIGNLHGKTIKVACFHYKPFVILDADPSVVPNGRDGIDIRTMDEFCKWLNCTIQIVREDEIAWGPMDGTGGGVIGDTAHGLADFGTTSLGMWYQSHKLMDYSCFCVRATVNVLTPKPSLVSRWELPLIAISAVTWVVLWTSMLFASAALYFAQRSGRGVLLTTYGILLAQPQATPPRWRVRSVTIWLTITGLVINAAYGAGLATLFTIPVYKDSIDTIEDLVESGMVWGATADAWIYSILLTEDPKLRQVINQFRAYTPAQLTAMSFNRSIAFGIEVLPSGFSAVGDYLTAPAVAHYHTLLEHFYYEYSVVMARKSSAFVGRLSEIVLRMQETGLLLAWDTQMAMKYLDYDVQLAIYFSRVKEPIETGPLTLKHIMGVFVILGFGVVAALVAFAAEILYAERVKHREKLRRCLRTTKGFVREITRYARGFFDRFPTEPK